MQFTLSKCDKCRCFSELQTAVNSNAGAQRGECSHKQLYCSPSIAPSNRSYLWFRVLFWSQARSSPWLCNLYHHTAVGGVQEMWCFGGFMWGCRQPVLLRRIKPVGWKAECSFHQTQTLQTSLLLLLSHSEILAQCLCRILRDHISLLSQPSLLLGSTVLTQQHSLVISHRWY